MVAGTSRQISPASARTHTRKPKPQTSSRFSGLFKKTLFVCIAGFLAWAYQAIQPPPPNTCGSADGPSVTAPRIQLKDGRHLAYKEFGVPKDVAKHQIVYVHGFDSCRHDVNAISSNLSPDIVESRGIYIVSFDRPGYGESDPHSTRTAKSLAFDIEELADQLGLGSKFYVLGFSMGGQIAWTCLKYIPHRLVGAALIAPVVNFWWPNIPSNLSQKALQQQLVRDQWTYRVVHHLPWLTYWWNTQKLFPSSSVIAFDPRILSRQDKELIPSIFSLRKDYMAQVRQQGEYESLHRDAIVGFGNWEFDPLDLKNPFPESEGPKLHVWQGDEDLFVSVELQRYIVQQLPWIQYHEVPGAGHMFLFSDGIANSIIQALLA